MTPLREKCPNTEFFLALIFPHSDWIRRDTCLRLAYPVSLISTSRIEHKGSIRYFAICAKTNWRHRLEVLLCESDFWNDSVFKINTTDKSIRFKRFKETMFLFRKIYFRNTWILAKIWEVWFKFVNAHSASCNPHNLAVLFDIELIWKLKHIILEIFNLNLVKLINSYYVKLINSY